MYPLYSVIMNWPHKGREYFNTLGEAIAYTKQVLDKGEEASVSICRQSFKDYERTLEDHLAENDIGEFYHASNGEVVRV